MSLATLKEKRQAAKADLDALLDKADATPEDETRADELIAEIKAQDARIADLEDIEARKIVVDESRAGKAYDKATRTDEAPLYRRDNQHERSFFGDAFSAEFRTDYAARERIEKHVRMAGADTQTRATTTASYAGLVVPQYLVEDAALLLRAGRPAANVCNKLELPPEGMTFQVPRGTTGASAAIQATEGSSVSNTDEVWTNVSVPVATIAGQQVVSRQSLERGTPGLDQLIYRDLVGAYAAALDTQVLNGSGSSGQALGILQTGSINASTAYGAAATVATFQLKVAGGVNGIASAGTAIKPRVIIMHPRRWAWLLGSVDSSNRPIVVPASQGLFNAAGVNTNPGAYGGDSDPFTGQEVVGYMQGIPVLTDSNVPTNVGGGSTEDVVIVGDNSQWLLWEQGDGMPRFFSFDATAPATLQVQLLAYGYFAFTAGRYPAASSKVGGADSTGSNGQQAPAF